VLAPSGEDVVDEGVFKGAACSELPAGPAGISRQESAGYCVATFDGFCFCSGGLV
jgi:hypothetical protein